MNIFLAKAGKIVSLLCKCLDIKLSSHKKVRFVIGYRKIVLKCCIHMIQLGSFRTSNYIFLFCCAEINMSLISVLKKIEAICGTMDKAMTRFFVRELLNSVSRPYSVLFFRSVVPILSHPVVRDSMMKDEDCRYAVNRFYVGRHAGVSSF